MIVYSESDQLNHTRSSIVPLSHVHLGIGLPGTPLEALALGHFLALLVLRALCGLPVSGKGREGKRGEGSRGENEGRDLSRRVSEKQESHVRLRGREVPLLRGVCTGAHGGAVVCREPVHLVCLALGRARWGGEQAVSEKVEKRKNGEWKSRLVRPAGNARNTL